MRRVTSIAALVFSASFFFLNPPSLAESSKASQNNVLNRKEIDLGIKSLENLLKEGEEFFIKEDFISARKKFDKSRAMAKVLLNLYSDLSAAFKGLDVRIPREMNSNSRKVLASLVKANMRLATIFRRTNQSELAVPLLVDVVRISSPTSVNGQLAYQQLYELGFVNTLMNGKN